RSKEDSRGVSEHAIFGPRPIQQFLNVFDRIGAVEPRIEHSVWKNEVWCRAAAQGAPDAEAVVLPQAVDNHGVVFTMSVFNPASKTRRVSVAAAAGTEGVDRHRVFANPRIARRIEANNFHAMAATDQN